MNQAFKLMQSTARTAPLLLATVVEGENAGEKALLRGSDLMTPLVKGSLLERHLPELLSQRDSGLISLEGQRVFVERFREQPRLIICGGGTVGLALVSMVKNLEFSVTVLEDRADYAEKAKERGADEVIAAPFEVGLAQMKGGDDAYFVVVTREHQYDTLCLRSILPKSPAYLGMMGSRKRVALLKDQLEAEGFSRDILDGIHAPIGLSIAAQTPEEIAVSIAAELIQVKNRQKRTSGYSKELLERLDTSRPCVLAQIVERKGSTPRDIGTKMVIVSDGTSYGTIGGGWMEADILSKALALLASGKKARLCRELLSPEGQGAANPMLCGGEQLVYLEVFK